eukprot:scaffold52731_cov19-Tisochrysis_lutea.AAC.1
MSVALLDKLALPMPNASSIDTPADRISSAGTTTQDGHIHICSVQGVSEHKNISRFEVQASVLRFKIQVVLTGNVLASEQLGG